MTQSTETIPCWDLDYQETALRRQENNPAQVYRVSLPDHCRSAPVVKKNLIHVTIQIHFIPR